MSGPWQIMSQVINDRKMYIAGRQLDPTQPLHGGNVEHAGGYTTDRELIEILVADLNAAEGR